MSPGAADNGLVSIAPDQFAGLDIGIVAKVVSAAIAVRTSRPEMAGLPRAAYESAVIAHVLSRHMAERGGDREVMTPEDAAFADAVRRTARAYLDAELGPRESRGAHLA